VRELRNLVERLVIMTDGDEIGEEETARALGGRPGGGEQDAGLSLGERVDRFEENIIREALLRHGGNVAETARELRTDRANLHRKMRRHGIRPREA
jgi:two-component system nitrogen regulation response regulator NtrX